MRRWHGVAVGLVLGTAWPMTVFGQSAVLADTQTFSGANTFTSSLTVRSEGREIILSTSAAGNTWNTLKVAQDGKLILGADPGIAAALNVNQVIGGLAAVLISSNTGNVLRIKNVSNSGLSSINFHSSTGTDIGGIGYVNPSVGSAFDDTMFIGPSAAKALVLATNGSERMRITASGSVGVGTASPEVLLHVNGDARAIGVTATTFTVAGSTTGYLAPTFGLGTGTQDTQCGSIAGGAKLTGGTVKGLCFYNSIDLSSALTIDGFAKLVVSGQAILDQSVTINVIPNTGGSGSAFRTSSNNLCSPGNRGVGIGGGEAGTACLVDTGSPDKLLQSATAYHPVAQSFGSGGGGANSRGNGAASTCEGGKGGAAGGGLWIVARGSMTYTAITAGNGSAGSAGVTCVGGGGGGGSGGTLALLSWEAVSVAASSVTLNGGAGGNAIQEASGGGGGGGGQLFLLSPNNNVSGTLTANGGPAGSSGGRQQASGGAGGSNGGNGGIAGGSNSSTNVATAGQNGRAIIIQGVPLGL